MCKELPVIFVVVNNMQLDMALKGMEKTTGRIDGTIFEVPMDACQFARSLGAAAFRCGTMEEFEQAVQEAVSHRRATVIELLTDRSEIPPTAHRVLVMN
ncbi:pyruvate oxidase [compost metagenome]